MSYPHNRNSVPASKLLACPLAETRALVSIGDSKERDYTGFSSKRAIRSAACVLMLLSGLLACESQESSRSDQEDAGLSAVVNSLHEQLQGASQEVQDAVGPQAEAIQSRTKAEVDKLFRWEYHVVDVPSILGSAELEKQLTELGAENWECFSVLPLPESVRVVCKKRPLSAINYLKYVPGL